MRHWSFQQLRYPGDSAICTLHFSKDCSVLASDSHFANRLQLSRIDVPAKSSAPLYDAIAHNDQPRGPIITKEQSLLRSTLRLTEIPDKPTPTLCCTVSVGLSLATPTTRLPPARHSSTAPSGSNTGNPLYSEIPGEAISNLASRPHNGDSETAPSVRCT